MTSEYSFSGLGSARQALDAFRRLRFTCSVRAIPEGRSRPFLQSDRHPVPLDPFLPAILTNVIPAEAIRLCRPWRCPAIVGHAVRTLQRSRRPT